MHTLMIRVWKNGRKPKIGNSVILVNKIKGEKCFCFCSIAFGTVRSFPQ